MVRRLKRLYVMIVLLLVIPLPSQPVASGGHGDDFTFIANRVKAVGLEVEDVKSLGGSVFLVSFRGFTPKHYALKMMPGERFKPLQLKARIIGNHLMLSRAELLKAGFDVGVTKDKVVLASGMVIDKAGSQNTSSPDTGGLLIDDGS